MYHLSFYRCYESKMFCSCGVKLEELFWILAQQQQHSQDVKSFSETKSLSWWKLADVLAFKYLTLILAWSCLILLSTIRDFVYHSHLVLRNSSPSHEFSVIIYTPPCWWKVGGSFVAHRTFVELHSKTVLLQSSLKKTTMSPTCAPTSDRTNAFGLAATVEISA